jgi:hypothetical protein
MSTEPQSAPPVGPASPRPRRPKLLLAIAALGFLLLVIAAWLSFSSPPNQSIALISPAEAARATAPRPFAQLRYKIRQFIYPVWRHFQRRVPMVMINVTILKLSPQTEERTGLGTPAATNADGLRAWIVKPEDLTSISARLQAMPSCELLSSPSSYVSSGNHAFFGLTLRRTGINLFVLPRVMPGSLSLIINASDSVFDPTLQPHGHAMTTNFEAAFKAILPPSGAVVLCDEAHADEIGKLHWLLLSATSLDAQGKPIRP